MVQTIKFKKDIQLSDHFKLSEFKCPTSNEVKFSSELVAMLEKFFNNCSRIHKVFITSGYRTPKYSVTVGGSKNDAHTYGIAADAVFYNNEGNLIPPKYIACYAEELGFGGIGTMQTAIHLDVRHLGGYLNKLWHGDEVSGYSLSANGKSFYQFFGLTKDEVYKRLGVSTNAGKEENEMRFERVKNLPEWAKPTIKKLIDRGIINGKGGSGDDLVIDLSEDAVRTIIITERMINNSKNTLWKAAGVRAIKTVAQTAVAMIGVSATITTVDWLEIASASALAGGLSLLTSIAGLPEVK